MTHSPSAARRLLAALGLAVLAGAWVFAVVRLWRTSVPSGLRLPHLDEHRFFSQAQLHRTADYQAFLRIDEVLASVAQVVALGFYAVKGERFVRESAAGRIGTGMLLGMLGLAFVWFAQFPFGLAALLWQHHYGTTDLNVIDWVINDWFSIGGQFLFISLALLVVMALAGVLRHRWWLVGGPALVAIGLAFAFVQPYLIPDLHKLRDPQIAADARRLAKIEKVPGTPVRVQNTHGKTSSPNAEAAGLGASKRVILWDTLVDKFPGPEVRAVLAHEFTHLRRNHVLKTFAWLALLLLPIGLVMEVVTRRRGGLYEPTAVPMAIFVVVALLFVLRPVQTAFSRLHEREADWGALQATRDPAAMQRLFQRFTKVALAEPRSPGWAHALLDDHPDAMERIEMAAAWRARYGGS